MGLRIKVFLVVGGVLSVLFFAMNSLLSYIIERDFSTLEQEEVNKNILRVEDALNNKVDELSIKLGDWAQWDDTYEYIETRDEAYVESNLQDETFDLTRLNFITILDVDGNVVFKKHVIDGEERPFPEDLKRHLQEEVLANKEHPGIHKETSNFSGRLIVMALRPVTSSDGTAPFRGWISFAYFLDDERVQEIAQITHIDVTFIRYDDPSFPAQFEAVRDRLDKDTPQIIEESEDGATIVGYTLLADENDVSIAILRIKMDREIYQRGVETRNLFTKILVGTSALVVVMTFALFEVLVLRKLSRLGREVNEVREGGSTDKQLSFPGKDEFARLAEEINRMLSSLRELETKRKESEKRFRTVADSAPVMIWMLDTEGKAIYFNKIWLDFTGRPLERELGDGWRENIHPEDIKERLHIFTDAFKERRKFSVEFRLRRADGTYAWVYGTGVPNFSPEGVFLGYLGTTLDITERKETDDRRQEYIDEIERMNQVMVDREIKMVELKEKIKMLEQGK